eukprot:96975_1
MPNNKAYLHGCYIASWNTLIFDTITETFSGVSTIWYIEQEWILYYQSARLFYMDDMMVGMDYFKHKNESWNHYLITNHSTIILDDIIDNSYVWPSDGFIIYYAIRTKPNSFPPTFSFNITSHNLANQIDKQIILDQQNDKCINSTGAVVDNDTYQYFDDCTQHFPLNSYLTLNDTDVDQVVFDVYPNKVFNDPTVLALTSFTIYLQRCIINITKINKHSDSDNPLVNISYSLQEQCYNRNCENFSFNWTLFDEIDNSVKIMNKYVNISIINESYHLCQVHDYNTHKASVCQYDSISIQHPIHMLSARTTLRLNLTENDVNLRIQSVGLEIDYVKHAKEFELETWEIASIIIGVVLLVIIILSILYYFGQKNKQLEQQLQKQRKYTYYLKNPMVLFVGIAFYDDNMDKAGFDGYVADLDGIDVDYTNIKKLCKLLNWDFYPKEENFNFAWTQKEITEFITKQAEIAALNINTLEDDVRNANKKVNGYDGLMIVFSGHGISNNVITSDYQLIDKTAIHRLISTNHSELRTIPRIVMFDVCDGSNERSYYVSDKIEELYEDDMSEDELERFTQSYHELNEACQGKNFCVGDIKLTKQTSIWKADEKNPDYRLSVVHGANEGFQSKMNSLDGSFLVYEFVKRMMKNIEYGGELFFGEIIDGIQEDLHNRGKQQISAFHNNNTRYLKFAKYIMDDDVKINKNIRKSVDENLNVIDDEKKQNKSKGDLLGDNATIRSTDVDDASSNNEAREISPDVALLLIEMTQKSTPL